ncbi:hypothetical protein CDLVIII_2787 [Clostridium sp. DL-VIII]|uniref:hypothetical protein n=1 Tax=Clostridium sp. DL-VIII TaxID=641107 RepID=UPI00023AFA75|nr:hypothetical protein [Clostridium sp. DL-VIII]EHI99386.1 hypothetical protein CDLVIII_2787 [Clostridium sp. DL-VIII]
MDDNNEVFELLNKMYSEIQGIKSDFSVRLDKIESRFDDLGHKVDKTNIIIENDIKPRGKALFDGYKQNTEAINIFNNKIEALQNEISNLTIRTVKNENNIIHYSKSMEQNI